MQLTEVLGPEDGVYRDCDILEVDEVDLFNL